MWQPKGQNELLVKKQSPWQEIRLYKNGDHYWMALNRVLQFHTKECYKSHQYMCKIPAMIARNPRRALVIGGGDGFAARELAKYPFIKEIVNVELDGDLIDMTKNHPIMQHLTDNSFNNPKVKVVEGDGINYLINTPRSKFDLIIDDCEYEYTGQGTDIENKKEKDRYEHYQKCLVNKLAPGGVACVMEPLIRVVPPKHSNLANHLIGRNRYFIAEDGRILDHGRHSQEQLRERLVLKHAPKEELDFHKQQTPYVDFKVFMSEMIGPEAYIYASNMPLIPRRVIK
jgi:hypothetical protein